MKMLPRLRLLRRRRLALVALPAERRPADRAATSKSRSISSRPSATTSRRAYPRAQSIDADAQFSSSRRGLEDGRRTTHAAAAAVDSRQRSAIRPSRATCRPRRPVRKSNFTAPHAIDATSARWFILTRPRAPWTPPNGLVHRSPGPPPRRGRRARGRLGRELGQRDARRHGFGPPGRGAPPAPAALGPPGTSRRRGRRAPAGLAATSSAAARRAAAADVARPHHAVQRAHGADARVRDEALDASPDAAPVRGRRGFSGRFEPNLSEQLAQFSPKAPSPAKSLFSRTLPKTSPLSTPGTSQEAHPPTPPLTPPLTPPRRDADEAARRRRAVAPGLRRGGAALD